jgi:hypothetical protein
MFPVFLVLFPVWSQFPGNRFIMFPAFPVSAARAMGANFLYSFVAHWEQWELDSNSRTSTSNAVEHTWNDRE